MRYYRPVSGLRERKKLATRAALGAAARSLAVEVGTENVRVADIADRAGVAPRTYNGYFGSREEAICALYADRAERIADALRARPADEPLLAAITAAITAEFLGPDPDRAALRLITRDPALRGEFLKDLGTLEAPLAAAIQDRLAQPFAAKAIAAATVAATRVALTHWLDSADGKSFAHHAAQALQSIANLS